jgi:hypothetical protein
MMTTMTIRKGITSRALRNSHSLFIFLQRGKKTSVSIRIPLPTTIAFFVNLPAAFILQTQSA